MQPDTEPPADPPPDIEALLTQLKSRSARKRARAMEGLRKCGLDAVQPLVDFMNEEAIKRRQLRPVSAILWFASFPFLYGFVKLNWRGFEWILAGVAMGVALIGLRLLSNTGTQIDAARTLLGIDDPRATGPLIEALAFRGFPDDRSLYPEAQPALLRLLPRLRADDVHWLTDKQRVMLYRALRTNDPMLTLAILRSLEQIGDGQAVPYVEKLLSTEATSAVIRKAAEAVLPALHDRAELERTGAYLLRPAQADDSALLHPASATMTDATPLVRASEWPDSQAGATVNVQESER